MTEARRVAVIAVLTVAGGLCATFSLAQTAATRPRRLTARCDHNYPPYEFQDENGQPAGFNVELLQAVAQVMGLEVVIKPGPWSELREDLERGRIDILTGMYFSKSRDRSVDFSTPYVVVSYALFVREGSSIRTLEDVRGRDIVVQNADIAHDFVLKHRLSDRISAVPDQEDALRALAAGRHDCAILARLQGLYLAHKLGLTNVTAVGPTIESRQYCFAVREGDSVLQAQLNEGLSVLKATGRYAEIHHKWFGVYEETAWRRLALRYLLWIGGPAVIVLAGAFAWSWSLRKQVALRTRELHEELAERRKIEQELALHRDHLEDLVRRRTDELSAMQETVMRKERLAALGQLTASVSHELRNPLGTIRSSFFLIAKALRDGDAGIKPVLQRAERSIVRCNRIIEELLDYARVKPPDLVPTDVDAWLAEMLGEQTMPPGIELKARLASGLTVELDRDRFRRCMINVVENACQAIEESGVPGEITVETRAQNGRLEVIITDNGPGIPPDHLERIFEPLYSTKSFGVGLGLPIVHRIMEMHGGGVEVSSREQGGTRLILWLPCCRSKEA